MVHVLPFKISMSWYKKIVSRAKGIISQITCLDLLSFVFLLKKLKFMQNIIKIPLFLMTVNVAYLVRMNVFGSNQNVIISSPQIGQSVR